MKKIGDNGIIYKKVEYMKVDYAISIINKMRGYLTRMNEMVKLLCNEISNYTNECPMVRKKDINFCNEDKLKICDRLCRNNCWMHWAEDNIRNLMQGN